MYKKSIFLLIITMLLTSFNGNTQNKKHKNKISREEIQEMYASMHDNGIDTDQKMLYGYYFTHTEPKMLEKIAAYLKNDGFNYVDIYLDEKEKYWLHMERIETHNPKSLYKLNKKLYAIASKYKINSYDGFDIGNPDKTKPIERDTYVVPEKYVTKDLIIEGLPKLILVNKAFENFPHKDEFFYFIVIKTKYTVEDASKLPSENELEILNNFEFFIENSLKQNKNSHYFIGRTTYNEQRVFNIVIKDKEGGAELMRFIKKFGIQREFEYKIIEDKEWKLYYDLMSSIE